MMYLVVIVLCLICVLMAINMDSLKKENTKLKNNAPKINVLKLDYIIRNEDTSYKERAIHYVLRKLKEDIPNELISFKEENTEHGNIKVSAVIKVIEPAKN